MYTCAMQRQTKTDIDKEQTKLFVIIINYIMIIKIYIIFKA